MVANIIPSADMKHAGTALLRDGWQSKFMPANRACPLLTISKGFRNHASSKP